MTKTCLRASLALALAAACGRDPLRTDPTVPPSGVNAEGQTSFESAVPGDAQAVYDRSAAGPTSAENDAAGGGAQPREVEEADIVRKDGDVLFVLNAWRGLIAVDVQDPDRPSILGRAPVFGQPVEMYVRDRVAYIVVSDYFTYWALESGAAGGRHGSQIVVVDMKNPSAPVKIGEFFLEGFVSDTRIVGDVLYAVSNHYPWYDYFGSADFRSMTYVASVNLEDPRAPYEVERVEFPGTAANVHPTSSLLYVAQPAAGRAWNDQATVFTVLDISDPAGDIAILSTFEVEGALGFWNISQEMARFQMDHFGSHFRVITHKGSNGIDGTQLLTVIDMSDPSRPTRLSELSVPHSGGLWATRFDGDRVYFVTLVQVDPLDIILLTDPRKPELVSSLEIPGLLRLVIPKGDRLLALATDSAWGGGVGMALFDVADPRRTRMLARVMFGAGTYGWSNATYDDKALRIVDDELALVPFSGYVTAPSANGYGRWTSGLGLLSIDLARGTLQARGFVETSGQVQRALPHQDRLLAMSDRVLVAVDHSDLDRPKVTAQLELARDVQDFAVAAPGDARVGLQLVGPDWFDPQPKARLRLVPLSDADGDKEALGEVTLAMSGGRLWTRGAHAFVVGYDWQSSTGLVQVFSVGADGSLSARGKLALPQDQDGWWYGQQGVALVDGAMAVVTERWEPMDDPAGPYGYKYRRVRRMHIIDLRDPDHPALGPTLELSGAGSVDLIAHGTTVMNSRYEHRRTLAGRTLGEWFVDRVDLADPQNPRVLRRVNVPGVLADVSSDGQLLYTVDYQYGADGRVENSLAVLWLKGDLAVLQSRVAVPERIERARALGRAVYVTTQRWWWDPRNEGESAWWRKSTLRAFDATEPTHVVETATLALDGAFAIRELLGGRLFLTLGGWGWGWNWDGAYASGGPSRGAAVAEGDAAGVYGGWYGGGQGLLVFGLETPKTPRLVGFFRTYGWVNQIAAATDLAFLASGLYGVQTVPLVRPL